MYTDTVVLDGTCTLVTPLDGSCVLDQCLDGDPYTVLKVREFEYYTGDYTVIPKAHEPVILRTNGLMMADDVTVTKVPYYETSNIYDGKTVYIAEETNG